jgi:nucleoid-associated protein YgaU
MRCGISRRIVRSVVFPFTFRIARWAGIVRPGQKLTIDPPPPSLLPAGLAIAAMALPAVAAAGQVHPDTHVVAGFVRPAAPSLSTSVWTIKAVEAEHATSVLGSYTVKPGDTLSAIAQKLYGSPDKWPALWYPNRHIISNPDLILAGQVLKVGSGETTPAIDEAAMAALPRPVVVTTAVVQTNAPAAPQQPPAAPQQPVNPPDQALGSPWPGGAFGNCVVSRESGGDSQVMNSTGHYGLYQFSYSTWVAYGGDPGAFGNASVSQQEQVFENAMASPGGADNWAPYDGC